MTPEATEMLNALNMPIKATLDSEIKKLSRLINPLVDVFREILLSDRVKFERIFLMNWSNEERYRIVGDFIKAHPGDIQWSPERDEVLRFSAEMITGEILADIFKSARIACGITLKEFVMAWRVLNESGEMKNIMFSKQLDVEKLHPQVKEVYLDEQRQKESENRIQRLMRENFLNRDEEED